MTENQNEPSNSQVQAKFLSDKPLTADFEQNDRFGHSGIAENLNQIVLTCPAPFTIGLFGKWGTGKTTVLNILKDRLRTQKVPVVIFDVWKHEGDALRRTFLKELVKQLKTQGLLKDFKLSEQVDSSIGIKKTFETLNIFNSVTYIFLGLMILLGVIFYLTDIPTFKGYLSIVTSSSLVAGLIIFLIQRMIVTEDITKTTNRFEDPHEFEDEFLNIIGKSNAQRLLIAIDNLDRCTHDNAVKLLSTIKTFLAKDSDTEKNNNCIFLITCDDEAIKKHLESVYIKNQNNQDSNAFNSDEFLRKFFNTFIRLPDFYDRELQDYTEELLKQTAIPQFDDPDVGYVITTAFRDNPRQIKQFINILIAHFLMAQNRESGEKPLIIPQGTITNNVAFLAKFLVIRQKFPTTYIKIKQEYLTRSEGRRLFDNVENQDFLRATKEIIVNDIRPFVFLKQSKDELAIPGIREIEEGLVANNSEIVIKKLMILKEEPQKNTLFNKFLLTLIRRNEKRPQILINIVNCALHVSNELKFELSKSFYKRIGHWLNDEDHMQGDLYKFSLSLVFNEILNRCKESDRDGIIAQYVIYISFPNHTNDKALIESAPTELSIGRDYAYNLLKEFVNNTNFLNNDQKAKIKRAIEKKYYNDIDILSLFENNEENQKEFISENTISKFVSGFSEEDVKDKDSINDKITLLLKFRPIIKSKTTESIITKLDELLEAENKLPLEGVDEGEVGQKQNLVNRIENVLSAVVGEIKSESSKENLNTFANNLKHGGNALPTWSERKLFVFSILLVIDLIDDPNIKRELEQFIQNFFSNADFESIKFIFSNKRLSRNKITKLIDRYPSVFQQRAVSLQPIFNELYPIASKKNRIEWLVALISSDHNRALQKLEAEGYKTDENKQIVQALLQKVTTVAHPEKHALYNTVNKMKCANDKTLKSTLVSQIKSFLKTQDPPGQKVGYLALKGAYSSLSGPNKRDIATDVIEWLRNLEPANAGQIHSVGSIVLVWNDLSDTRQGDYVDFISDKLIIRGTSLDSIKLGIQTLIEVKPTYENYSKQYDDIFARFETESDKNIKIVINGGLVNLKPEKTNKENKAFWDKIH